jgi:outer membrane protein with beta-barrel domain
MKALLLLSLLAQASSALPALPRADVHATAGWQNLRKEQPIDSYNEWLNAILYGGAGAGWYWTDHLKTQIDFGAGTRDEQYQTRQFVVDGQPAYASSRAAIRETNVSIGQQYQFFRNQWFHPHAGVGVELAHETTTQQYLAVTIYDPATRTSKLLSPEHAGGPEHRFLARPFAEGGFKAYMSRRAFFLGDMRVMFRGGIDEVLFRAGFGIDF